ncbi:MAG: hypothetical protein V3V00_08035 [Saprospiraceae bacterium]
MIVFKFLLSGILLSIAFLGCKNSPINQEIDLNELSISIIHKNYADGNYTSSETKNIF